MTRISESELVLPVLYILNHYGSTDTSRLIKSLRNLLNPTGEDLEILQGRNDDKFSQKVRNLKSHDTLIKNGLAKEATKGNTTVFTITDKGGDLYYKNQDNINSLLPFPFDLAKETYGDLIDENIIVLNENLTEEITEGAVKTTQAKIRERSSKLRNAAIEHYSHDGVIDCNACYFNFENKYGELGEGYIEIHHTKPLYTRMEEALRIEDALEHVIPLCANCHRMVHRKKEPISIENLKEHIKAI